MFAPLRAVARDPEGKVLLASAVATIAIGTVAYMRIEGWSPVDALYFCVVTLATVGYGDIHPTTEVGRLFTVAYILSGVGILAGFVSELTKQRRSAIESRPPSTGSGRRPEEPRGIGQPAMPAISEAETAAPIPPPGAGDLR
ncbi:MAG TPA: potassium channel family protein [Candidatus Limnocylindrales bacterium]|nr:potassium channel family protein [Candidatus Limnocylindrales bacterium]